ncbi:MAG: GNAT family N-acetyltransferase [Elusimicrobia bacterium]|nr:GNAT family N-acetyltransferase [Elusimicrobiota bacterium]
MIRKMKKEDLPAVKSLMQSVPKFWHEVWTDETLERGFTVSEGLSFVYEADNQIAGCIFGYNLGFRGYLGELAVYEKMRKHGIGKKLLLHLENILREQGCEIIIADAWKTAEPFYRKLGWSEPHTMLLHKKLIDK